MSTEQEGASPRLPVMVPLMLLALALAGSLAVDTLALARGLSVLTDRAAAVDARHAEAQKVRAQFDALVKGAAHLAEQGHPQARQLMEELAQAGVNVHRGGDAGEWGR